MIEVHYQRGIELPQLGLWLDPRHPKPLAFVSHAHSDHIARHQTIITSAGTSRLLEARMPGRREEHLLPFNEPTVVRDLELTLLHAGHICGSAQLHLQHDHGSLLYTGDFKLRAGLSTPAAQWRQAHTLIMETTFGLPKYRMPPNEAVLAQVVEFCRETLEDNVVPVLLGYSLGKAQEILCALLHAGLKPMLHESVFQMTEVCRTFCPDFPGGYELFNREEIAGKVLVWPPHIVRSHLLARIPNRRTAVLTGWAIDPGAKYRYGTDAAFPLSDHADYDDLLRYVELVNPERVLTVHGFATEFARDLRARGIEAWALGQANQLEFTM